MRTTASISGYQKSKLFQNFEFLLERRLYGVCDDPCIYGAEVKFHTHAAVVEHSLPSSKSKLDYSGWLLSRRKLFTFCNLCCGRATLFSCFDVPVALAISYLSVSDTSGLFTPIRVFIAITGFLCDNKQECIPVGCVPSAAVAITRWVSGRHPPPRWTE